MKRGKVNYKSLGSSCEVYVRQLSPSRSEARLIANFRKDSKPSAGFIVDLDYTFALHTLVEMDVKFPGQSFYYRARGVVESHGKGTHPEKPYRLGIRITAMQKLDPTGSPMTPPKQKTMPYSAMGNPAPPPVSESKAIAETSPTAVVASPTAAMVEPEADAPTSAVTGETTHLKLPKAREISELLASLTGEKVTVTKSPSPLDIDSIAVAGDYRGEEGMLLSVMVTDIALANWLGAALAMIPKEVARKDIDGLKVSEETFENTQEIFNIQATVFNVPDQPHHRFGKLFFCFDDEQPDDVQALMEKHASRIDFNVDVPGYGSGQMAILLSAWQKEGTEDGGASIEGTDEGLGQNPVEEPDGESQNAEPQYKIAPAKSREIAELLTNLVGEAVTVKKSDAPLDVDDFASVGDFVDDAGDPKALCAMDIALSNWVAAALAMIPKDVVKKDIENWKLSEESRENVQEILNISASMFNKPTMPHLRFGQLYVSLDGDLPMPIMDIIEGFADRVDFSVEIPGYGTGVLSCIYKAL